MFMGSGLVYGAWAAVVVLALGDGDGEWVSVWEVVFWEEDGWEMVVS